MTAYPPTAQVPQTLPPAPKPRGAWSLSWHGVSTVAKLELTQRVRSTRWKASLIVWFVVIGGVCLLINSAVSSSQRTLGGYLETGPIMFALTVLFVMSMGFLVTPSLSSTAINGDRNAGTLAILQVTLLTPIEITLGKLLAGWCASLVFLAVCVPFVAWSLFSGGVGFLAVLTTLGVLAIVLAVISAVSLAFSACLRKTSGSTLLSYLATAGLTIFTVVLFGLTILIVSGDETSEVLTATEWDSTTGEVTACDYETRTRYVTHTERIWWLLALNPYVLVADAAPETGSDSSDPLSAIRSGVRQARAGESADWSTCPSRISGVTEKDPSDTPVWPWGLALNLAIGAGAVATTVNRLKTPQRKLARGTRVA